MTKAELEQQVDRYRTAYENMQERYYQQDRCYCDALERHSKRHLEEATNKNRIFFTIWVLTVLGMYLLMK